MPKLNRSTMWYGNVVQARKRPPIEMHEFESRCVVVSISQNAVRLCWFCTVQRHTLIFRYSQTSTPWIIYFQMHSVFISYLIHSPKWNSFPFIAKYNQLQYTGLAGFSTPSCPLWLMISYLVWFFPIPPK